MNEKRTNFYSFSMGKRISTRNKTFKNGFYSLPFKGNVMIFDPLLFGTRALLIDGP